MFYTAYPSTSQLNSEVSKIAGDVVIIPLRNKIRLLVRSVLKCPLDKSRLKAALRCRLQIIIVRRHQHTLTGNQSKRLR